MFNIRTMDIVLKFWGKKFVLFYIWSKHIRIRIGPGCVLRIRQNYANPTVLRIRDVHPGSWFLPIPDPGSKNSNKRDGWKKICCHTFLCSHKFHKIGIILVLKCRKIFFANFQRIMELFTQKKLSLCSQKYGFGIRDPRSEIRDPGVKKAPDAGSGSATLQSDRIRIRIRVYNAALVLWFVCRVEILNGATFFLFGSIIPVFILSDN